MSYSSRISAPISEENLREILKAIEKIKSLLPDYAGLSDEQTASLPKVGKSTIDFVYETMKLADEFPDLVPDKFEVPEIQKDLELIDSVKKVLKPLKKLVRRLEGSAVLAGSEAYLPSIAIYNAVKTIGSRQAAKQDLPTT
jgi:hypothetical protein